MVTVYTTKAKMRAMLDTLRQKADDAGELGDYKTFFFLHDLCNKNDD